MSLSRKHFISAAALAVSAAALAETSAPAKADATISFHILKPNEFDKTLMMQKLTLNAEHKQVFHSSAPIIIAPGVASIYIHMQNSMNAYQYSLGLGNLATLGVFLGISVFLGFNDDMWKKYPIGKILGAGSSKPTTNVYYKATSNLDLSADPDDPKGIYQDWSAQAVLKRGGQFFICHNATTAMAYIIGQAMGTDPKAILADFEKSLLPGFQFVPAGVATVQQAQELGWKPFSII